MVSLWISNRTNSVVFLILSITFLLFTGSQRVLAGSDSEGSCQWPPIQKPLSGFQVDKRYLQGPRVSKIREWIETEIIGVPSRVMSWRYPERTFAFGIFPEHANASLGFKKIVDGKQVFHWVHPSQLKLFLHEKLYSILQEIIFVTSSFLTVREFIIRPHLESISITITLLILMIGIPSLGIKILKDLDGRQIIKYDGTTLFVTTYMGPMLLSRSVLRAQQLYWVSIQLFKKHY